MFYKYNLIEICVIDQNLNSVGNNIQSCAAFIEQDTMRI